MHRLSQTSPSSPLNWRRRSLEEIQNLYQRRSDHHHHKEGNQDFVDGKLIRVFGCLADRNGSSLVNVPIELSVSVTDIARKRL